VPKREFFKGLLKRPYKSILRWFLPLKIRFAPAVFESLFELRDEFTPASWQSRVFLRLNMIRASIIVNNQDLIKGY
jgi:hypothetical protein